MKDAPLGLLDSSNELLSQQLYWTMKLSGTLPESVLFRSGTAPAGHSKAFNLHTFRLSPALSEWVLKLSKNSAFSTYLVLVSALKILLSKYLGNEDVIVGSPVYQPDFDVEPINGVLPLRSRVSGNLRFKEYLLQVKQTVVEAYSNQNYPFRKIADLLNIPTRNGWFPILDIVILLENLHDQSRVREIDNEITFSFMKVVGEITCQTRYNSGRFEEAEIERLAAHYTNILRGVSQNPDVRISELSPLTKVEEYQLLVEFNRTNRPAREETGISASFEERARTTPDRIAVKFDGQECTYGQLNDRANQVAYCLRSFGVRPEVLVAVLAKRGDDLLAAVLGIFKAGGVYLPLDLMSPPKRLAQVLLQSQASLVLVDAEWLTAANLAIEGWPLDERPPVAVIEDLLRTGGPQCDPPALHTPPHLAYVIYTSGSTGAPKGAMVEHRGMFNHLCAKVEDLKLTPGDIVAQTAAQSFDISIWQLLTPLLIGGQVNIVSPEIAQDPPALLKTIELEQVTILEIVPSLLSAMLGWIADSREGQLGLESLRWVMVTGEALPSEHCRQWLRRFPRVGLINAYGPTECSDDVTHHFLTEPPAAEDLRIPIGKPLADCRLYILDQWLKPSPIGIGGELFVGGVGVGRGYLNDARRTAEAFIPDSLGQEAGGKLYRTGDLACHRTDGAIEFLGRVDQQIKVRGYRIELGEVEAVLRKSPGVKDAAVLAIEDETGDKRLVAYVVSNGSGAEIRKQLREHLRNRLPEYMVPSSFVLMDALPLTQNGKVNRRILSQRGFATSDPEPLRTPVEEILAGSLAEVLRLDEVDLDKDFFELGGHSLLAIRLISKIRAVLGVEVELREIFERSTMAGLAQAIEQAGRTDGAGEAPPIVQVSRLGELPLSFAQRRLWFIQQLEPESFAYNVMLAVRMRGPIEIAVLRQGLSEIGNRHEVLRTRFVARWGRPEQQIDEPGEILLPIWDLGEVAENEREDRVRDLAALEMQRPFDLEQGPVWRAALAQMGQEDYVLLLCLHHIACDGWSTGVMIKEITQLYQRFRQGHPSDLPELKIQYADFAAWQSQWLQGEALEEHLKYWRRQLARAPVLRFGTNRGQPPGMTGQLAANAPFIIPVELTKAVKRLSRSEGVTLFMTLLAVYQITLGRYGNQEDVVVGTDVAGRNRMEIEGLIGFFINQLALRVRLEDRLTFRELLGRVREVTLGAYAHQDLPYEKLVEAVAPTRDHPGAPLFEASLVLQNMPQEQVDLPMFRLSPFTAGPQTAKFPLTLRVEESHGQLTGALSYATHALHRSDAELLVAQLKELLGIVTIQPDLSLSSLKAKLDEFDTKYRAARRDSVKGVFERRLSGRRQPHSRST